MGCNTSVPALKDKKTKTKKRPHGVKPTPEDSKSCSFMFLNTEQFKNNSCLYDILNNIDIDENDVLLNAERPVENISKVSVKSICLCLLYLVP